MVEISICVRYIWSQYLTTETHYQILCVSLLASEVEDYSLCGYCYSLKKQGTVGEYIVEIRMWTKCICAFIITHTHTHTHEFHKR